MNTEEHPFAPFIRALGKGRNGSRALSEEEAYTAMSMILSGAARPIQIGAFLMLMRVKEETAAEVAGFVRAVRERFVLPAVRPRVRLDWPAYAGKRRQLPWFLLSALLLAEHGIPVFMHGTEGYDAGRLFVPDALAALGLRPSASLADAAADLEARRFAFLPLSRLAPAVEDLMQLRPLLGLRSPVHTVARMLNPFGAETVLQGIFHPGYRDIHQGAAALLGIPRAAVFKGEGGEAERNPDGPCLVKTVIDGVAAETEWPALFAARHLKDQHLDPQRLAAVWRGEAEDEYGEAAVVGSAAIALHLLGEAATPTAAQELAHSLWRNRAAAPARAEYA